jgi:hypothetical protein
MTTEIMLSRSPGVVAAGQDVADATRHVDQWLRKTIEAQPYTSALVALLEQIRTTTLSAEKIAAGGGGYNTRGLVPFSRTPEVRAR